MATKIVCDRCECEIDEKMYSKNKLRKENIIFRFPTVDYCMEGDFLASDVQVRKFDLCPKCQADVLNYITGGRKVNK